MRSKECQSAGRIRQLYEQLTNVEMICEEAFYMKVQIYIYIQYKQCDSERGVSSVFALTCYVLTAKTTSSQVYTVINVPNSWHGGE